MILVHAGICDDRVLVWGESSDFAGSGVRAAGASPVSAMPYAATHEQLSSALKSFGGDAPDAQHVYTILMPTADGMPVASSPLITEEAQSGAECLLRPWLVPAVEITVDALIELLPAAQQRVIAYGVGGSDDLRFWQKPLEFAAGLVSRGRYLPGLRHREEGWFAVWEPVIAGDDLERLMQLVRSAPDVWRAMLQSGHSEIGSLQMIYRSVSLFVDHFVRKASSQGTASGGASLVAATHVGALQPPPPSAHMHDRWLNALRSSDGQLPGGDEEIMQLQNDLSRWKRSFSNTLNAPFRLCFRLEEPAHYADARRGRTKGPALQMQLPLHGWKLSYLLQSTHDPSLLLPAEDVWGKTRVPAFLGSSSAVREYLLAALGVASSIYPPVENSLLNPKPAAAELDLEEAFKFLSEQASVLQDAGFGVMLPDWWKKKRKERVSAFASDFGTVTPKYLGIEALFKFKWKIALGDHPLTLEELEELATLKVPLVQLRGEWIEVRPEEIAAAIALLKKQRAQLSTRDFIELTVGARQLPGGIEFRGTEGDTVLDGILPNFHGHFKFDEIDTVPEFNGELRPYQRRGYSWLDFFSRLGLGACLADDMGLGKTVQTLALIQKNWSESNGSVGPILLICPTSVVGNWRKEIERFTPSLPFYVHQGSKRLKGDDFLKKTGEQAIVVSSYALLVRDFDLLKRVLWAGVVLDEAQNIKNPESQQTQRAYELSAGFKIALTGTPVENNVGDLWSIMNFLNPGFLGSQYSFKNNFVKPIHMDRDEDAQRRLHQLTSPFILRRLKTDTNIIKDLPEKIEVKEYCSLTPEQVTLYEAVLKETEELLAQAELPGEHFGIVGAALTKLKQVCDHPALFLHDQSHIGERSGKLTRLIEILDEALQEGDRALIFTQFAEMGALLKPTLQETFGSEVLYLHGGVEKSKRDEMIERFQSENGPRIFVLSLKAGGVGLNLTRANLVIHYDRWWNPAVENQATDRAYRIGQKQRVQVHKFICEGTLEDSIDKMIESKSAIAGQIVGTGEGWLTKLNNEQLNDVLKLRKEFF